MPLRFLRYITAFYEAYLDEHPGIERLPAVFPLLLYNGDDPWGVPDRIEEMIEATIPDRFIPRLGKWLRNYLETGGRGDPETVDRVKSTREVKAMFGTKLKQYGERVAQEAAERARKEGREEGREVEREEIALRMLDQGRSVKEIAEATGLSKEQIEILRK